MKQHIVRIAIGLAVLLLFVGHAAKFYQISLVSQLDSIIYDNTNIDVTVSPYTQSDRSDNSQTYGTYGSDISL